MFILSPIPLAAIAARSAILCACSRARDAQRMAGNTTSRITRFAVHARARVTRSGDATPLKPMLGDDGVK